MDVADWGSVYDVDQGFDEYGSASYSNLGYSSYYDAYNTNVDYALKDEDVVMGNNGALSFAASSFFDFTSNLNPMLPIKQEPLPNFATQQNKSVLPLTALADVILPKQQPKPPAASVAGSLPYNLSIETQPPVEVRTRTPNEIRTFSIHARVGGNFRKEGVTIMKVALYYAPNDTTPAEPVKKDILGGTKTVAILSDGSAIFDNLTISESSTKHKEREFAIQVLLLRNDGQEIATKFTRAFYAYSHKKVLQRRGSVLLRTLSKSWGRFSGGDSMHVIGTPFIQGPALGIVFRTPHGDISIKNVEYYSDSVIFFELPAYPIPDSVNLPPDTEIKVNILVTNDGRTMSNPLEFTYITDGLVRSRI
eukprot:TRINITY_DN1954_c0_g1_i1.p1 TRINITY_DN1954_c0_g1~~TRINITY_DN1954_c0_g1_i1.p1  ORF type:complete len:363 (-),score=88.43 TRINITY_DN1954_c0_g1_i1:891-1979(-)